MYVQSTSLASRQSLELPAGGHRTVGWPADGRPARILVGVSGTGESLAAVRFAASVIARDGSEVVLVSAVRSSPSAAFLPLWEDRVWNDALRADAYLLEDRSKILEIQRRAREAVNERRALTTRELLREGNPFDVLRSAATEIHADVVVLGGGKRSSRLARRLDRKTDCEVIVVDRESGAAVSRGSRGQVARRWPFRSGTSATEAHPAQRTLTPHAL